MNAVTPAAITGPWKALLGFSYFAAVLALSAASYYYPLGNDGGWYSFPAAAMSQGASPAQNLEPIEALESQQGLRAKFPFKTYTSVRTPYTALWFKLVPRNIYFLKLISLLELVALAIAAYFLISRFCGNRLIAIALVAVLLNDKHVILGAAADYRPDNILAALACCAFACLLAEDRKSNLGAAIVAIVLMMLVHVTAPIAVAFVLPFFVFKNLFSGKIGIQHHYKYVLAGAVALIVFFNYDNVLDALLFVDRPFIDGSMTAAPRVLDSWLKGAVYIFGKEFARWRGFFPSSNLTQLVVLLAGFAFLIRRLYRSSFRDSVALALLCSTSLVLLFMAAFDPHKAPRHVILVLPMLLLFLGYGLQAEFQKKSAEIALAILVGLVSVSSVALAAKIAIVGSRTPYNIASLRTFMSDILDRDRNYVIVAPTELWPFVDSRTNVLILDHTRPSGISEELGSVVEQIDYVIINRKYADWNWNERFMKSFPDLRLVRIRHMGDSRHYVSAYRIEEGPGQAARSTKLSPDPMAREAVTTR